MSWKTYVHKSTRVKAEQWFPGKDVEGVIGWQRDLASVFSRNGDRLTVNPGDYVIKEMDGLGHYVCDRAVFEESYHGAEEEQEQEQRSSSGGSPAHGR